MKTVRRARNKKQYHDGIGEHFEETKNTYDNDRIVAVK